jgi:hypothetical protein
MKVLKRSGQNAINWILKRIMSSIKPIGAWIPLMVMRVLVPLSLSLEEIVKIKMQIVLVGKRIAHQQIMVSGWVRIVQKAVENAALEMFALKLTKMQIVLIGKRIANQQVMVHG